MKACHESESLIASVSSFRKYDEKCSDFAKRERSIVICLPGKCQVPLLNLNKLTLCKVAALD